MLGAAVTVSLSVRAIVVADVLPTVTLRGSGVPKVRVTDSPSSSAVSLSAVTVKVFSVSLLLKNTEAGTPV